MHNMKRALAQRHASPAFLTSSVFSRFTLNAPVAQPLRFYAQQSNDTMQVPQTFVGSALARGYRKEVDPVTNAEVKQWKPTRKFRKQLKDQQAVQNNSVVADIRLNTLAPLPGAKKMNIKRLGRGRGSGRGHFCTRGSNGQKSRTSVNIPVLFEGGGKPLYIRVPKHGFNNRRFALRYAPISLAQIQYWIDTKRIDPEEGTITIKTLHDAGLLHRVKWPGFKLLSNGKEYFNSKIDIEVQRASKQAITAVEKSGGSIRSVYFNRRGLHAILHPEKYNVWNVQTVHAMPPPKLFKYYMQPEIRGYMADTNPLSAAREVVPDAERAITREKQEQLLQKYLKDMKGKGSKKK